MYVQWLLARWRSRILSTHTDFRRNLEAEIAKNQEALDKATAIREKQLAEFNAEEKDLLQSIGALKSAIVVLSKHHAAPEMLLDVAAVIQHQFKKHKDLLEEIVTPAQQKAVSAFVQAPGDYFDADPTFKQSYAPQSGEIFGILKQMKECARFFQGSECTRVYRRTTSC